MRNSKQFTITIQLLIVLVILINSIGMLFPLLTSTFAPYYASIAKHIVLSHNWTDLVLSGEPWMDKPHLPFWVSALSFKIFGINSFAYILPGFLFYLLGLYYTYRLARLWYNQDISILAVLFAVSSLHLMLSSIDVRAEAYLIGEIMPACYYWLKYDRHTKIKYLLLGSVFTACALMTKGIFTLVTITSGLIVLWLYSKQWYKLVSFKWLSALFISIIFIAPELWALHKQFDLNPHIKVFSDMHISALRWYFWDSQFGRFFNTGPIVSASPMPLHYLFFVHTFLWAFLPWCLMFFAATWNILIVFANGMRGDYKKIKVFDAADVYFLTSFFITFILFSLTTFQVDHYTNIIFPFAAIICANWFYTRVLTKENGSSPHPIFYVQAVIALLLIVLSSILGFLILDGTCLLIIKFAVICGVICFLYLLPIRRNWRVATIVYPTVAMCIAFTLVMLVNGVYYARYDVGYQMARYLNMPTVDANNYPVVGYNLTTSLLSLDFHLHRPYYPIDKHAELYEVNKPFYLVISANDLANITRKFPHSNVAGNFAGTSIGTYIANIRHENQLHTKLDKYIILFIAN